MTTKALEGFLGTSLKGKALPKIAYVFSGGGYRAMLSTLGTLVGMRDSGMLHVAHWLVGLSGSTWALGSWISSQKPITEFRDELIGKIDKPITNISLAETELLFQALLAKWAMNLPITAVDMYGCLLANRLFFDKGASRQRVYLSEQAQAISANELPLPIYTAIQTGQSYIYPRWFEFTPYEIGSAELSAYVAPWSFGRPFDKGVSQNFAPEQSLGYFLGIYGSAFAAPYETMYKEIMSDNKNQADQRMTRGILDFIGSNLLSEYSIGKKRIYGSWGSVYNFTKGLPTSPIKDQRYIRLSDAGIDFNLPYPPISGERPERKADIIIFFDYSSNIKSSNALRYSEAYARRKKLAFPAIKYAQVASKAISVFGATNDDTPMVIYVPLVRDEELWKRIQSNPALSFYAKVLGNFDPVTCITDSFCATFNFAYERKQAEQLSLFTECTFKAIQKTIIDSINTWIVMHNAK